jgi:hypothetical protein
MLFIILIIVICNHCEASLHVSNFMYLNLSRVVGEEVIRHFLSHVTRNETFLVGKDMVIKCDIFLDIPLKS